MNEKPGMKVYPKIEDGEGLSLDGKNKEVSDDLEKIAPLDVKKAFIGRPGVVEALGNFQPEIKLTPEQINALKKQIATNATESKNSDISSIGINTGDEGTGNEGTNNNQISGIYVDGEKQS